MNKDQIDNLADTIAESIRSASVSDFRSLKDSIDKLSARLDKVEAGSLLSTARVDLNPNHPSQERFAVAEAIADSIFGPQAKEKACTFEPDRPCDHCSMCSSRGF